MTSSRRSSVQRHIDNYNIHNGMGQIVTYVEYSMGIREGKYRPQNAPPFTRAKVSFFDRAQDKIEVELENQIVSEIASRICKKLASSNKAIFDNLESVATTILIKKNFYRLLKESSL
jgi:hypothetical protein